MSPNPAPPDRTLDPSLTFEVVACRAGDVREWRRWRMRYVKLTLGVGVILGIALSDRRAQPMLFVAGPGIAICSVFLVQYLFARPRCSRCQSAKEDQFLGLLHMHPPRARQVVLSGEIGKLSETPFQSTRTAPAMYAYICPNCVSDAPIELQLEEVMENGARNSVNCCFTYPGEALPILQSFFAKQDQRY